jgi:polyisoprenyl-phosphate glycosyltransferase
VGVAHNAITLSTAARQTPRANYSNPPHLPHQRNLPNFAMIFAVIDRMRQRAIDISAVVPIYNEADNLPELRRRLVAALEDCHRTWEIIFVDDGSHDRSSDLLREFHAQDPRVKSIHLSRNFGHQPAVTAGVHCATGACVALLDGDLQDPPELLPKLVAKWAEGFQVVLAERATRPEHGARGLGFKLFYPLLRKLSDLPAGPDAGIFCLMDRAVVAQFNRLPERNRFIPGLRSWLGFRQTSVSYDRQERNAGAPKQSLAKLIKYAMDAMISFSYRPLRWVTYAGFFISSIAFLLAIYYLIEFIYRRGRTYGSGFTTTIMCLLFLGGVQLISIGILGEYVGRIYEEIKQRPLYIVQEMVGFSDDEQEKAHDDAPVLTADVQGS